ncbi:hypothetical protein Esi_1828_0001 [Ectocarpus siliculosus]|uniref:Uncharacterized protein n=1 Tax=Ectocarpus siliculosus TaxID=2880 RepID=D7FNX0_ECTSI|nr:hypothetical protein Esi_1828_0001 [Ectocarpus siliculosus]|eukprot:CBJ34268.1 hypothetical protein Esi_1828_0001 [Ectocarpus siliculosus]
MVFISDEHPYGGVVVIDPDLVRSGGSSNGGGSARSSIPRSSVDDEARSGGRRSWTASPPTAEMSTQTTQGEEGVAHVLVQAGDGKLLSEAELREEYTQRELRQRSNMMWTTNLYRADTMPTKNQPYAYVCSCPGTFRCS